MWRFLSFIFVLSLSLPVACTNSKTAGESSSVPPLIVHFHGLRADASLSFSLSEGELQPLADDQFGRRWLVNGLEEPTALIVSRGGTELDRLPLEPGKEALWFYAGSQKAFDAPPPLLPESEGEVVVYFLPSPAQAGKDWGLHVWDASSRSDWTRWDAPLPLAPQSPEFGYARRLGPAPATPYSGLPAGSAAPLPSKIGLIVHRGDDKASPDLVVDPTRQGSIVFISGASGKLACSPDLRPCGWEPPVEGAAAHWVGPNELLWRIGEPEARSYLLLASPGATLDPSNLNTALQDPTLLQLALKPIDGRSAAAAARFSHLDASFRSFSLDPGQDLKKYLQSELLLVALNERQRIVAATRPQLAGVLDQAFAYKGSLGLVLDGGEPLVKLWAPTAQAVRLNVYAADKKLLQTLPMSENAGVWSASIPRDWVAQRLYYRYAMKIYHPESGRLEFYEVTDPYAVSGSRNGAFSQFLDLNEPSLKPEGWDSVSLGPIERPTDMVFYELHIRDFSARDASVPPELRGSYEAFTLNGEGGRALSLGMQHLKSLADAGLTHVQVLPAYDFGSVNEDKSQTINIDEPLAKLCASLSGPEAFCQDPGARSIFDLLDSLPRDGQEISRVNAAIIERDSFNWGYDPVHYGMPEGSYLSAQGDEGAARVLQFRTMAQSLAELGIHLAMDVVYNHTYASGLAPFSVLDKVVPGYYHRLNPISGAVERSSCCENTASEHAMMEKLMVDTLRRWQRDYKVDAFRFDLMGLHFKDNMLNVAKALGPGVFLFGEGWSMGEVSADARRERTATQLNMAGTGIATFNDRFRDALRGGGPMDCGVLLTQQSPLSGLSFDDNGRGGLLEAARPNASCEDPGAWRDLSPEKKRERLFALQDRLRLGLVGSLADYNLKTFTGASKQGREIDYGGQSAGYTAAPGESINYIENHDNHTFWDIAQLKLPYALSMEERVRVHALGLAFNMLALGVPYFEMGAEFLRSKSLVRDSYNAGDWYNQVDFSFERSNWNRGLPSPEKDGPNLAVIRDAVQNLPERPSKADTLKTVGIFRDLLAIRRDAPLLRLASGAAAAERISFLAGSEKIPGVIAMRIADGPEFSGDLDPRYEEMVLVFNLQPNAVTLPYQKALQLHPWQQAGADARVKTATADGTNIRVPPRTAAIFVR